ncbi:MAG: helix-turn-helix transcriptional regulator [Chloroflexi bacterium]|nr:helix-turn-helix transcriptional regulator [Chloroflexota bacterium]
MTEPATSEAFCPYFHRAIELIGARWTGAIIRALLAGVTRFSDFSSAIPGLSDRMLSERLKELEAEGIVVREVTPSTPVRVEYHLTEKGRALAAVTEAVSAWAADWLEVPDESRHEASPVIPV